MPHPRTSSRRLLVAASVAASAVLMSAVVAGCASGPRSGNAARATTTSTASSPAADPLAGVRVVGRVVMTGGVAAFTWPGTAFEARFAGTAVGVVLDDTLNDYDVLIDGAVATTLVQPGRGTFWVRGLPDGEHTVRLVKRTESPWKAGRFGGFVPGPGGRLLDPPPAPTRQIEFLGDSLTAGYGNLSTRRTCAEADVPRRSNADRTYAALTARALGADLQLIAWSGMGLVRNHAGRNPESTLVSYAGTALQGVPWGPSSTPAGTWAPQVVVVGLGTNDFSTPVGPGERWPDGAALAADYRTKYLRLIEGLRARYGRRTLVVVGTSSATAPRAFPAAARQVVQDRQRAGDDRVVLWDHSGVPVDRLGCHSHFSLHDEQVLAEDLRRLLASQSPDW